MKRRSLLLLALIFGIQLTIQGQTLAIKNPQLSNKINYLTEKYQDHHNRKTEILRAHGMESKQMKDNETLVKEAFDLNYKTAKKIIDEHGFPGYGLVGEESSRKFWEMVLRFNHDVLFQTKVLRLMERAVHKNDASMKDFAYLADRVLLNSGKEQYYGTQLRYDNKQKTYVPRKIVSVKLVNIKRASIGLPPLEEYIAQMNSKYAGVVAQKPKVKKYYDSVGRPPHVIERLRNN